MNMIFVMAVGAWIQALGGADSPAREAAMDSLVASGEVTAVADAVFEENWRCRDGLIAVLERLAAVDALERIANEHTKIDAQRLAIRSLGQIRQAKARAILLSLLDLEHRDLAVEALGLVGDVADTQAVSHLLQDERADVRRRAALALARLAGQAAVPKLVLLLGDAHHSVRFAVYDAVLAFGQTGAQVTAEIYDGLSVVGKQQALRLFGELRFLPAQVILTEALRGEQWQIQLAAVRALAVWGDDVWGPTLKKAQKEVSSPIVKMAIQQTIAALE